MGVKLLTLKEAYKQKSTWVASIIGAGAIGTLLFYFTDYTIIAGNLGQTYAFINSFSQVLLTVLFGLTSGLLWHKKVGVAKQGGIAGAGGFLGALVAGCPACGVTLAGILGLGGIASALPFFGLELKVVGIGLLTWSSLNLLSGKCKIKS